MPKTRIGLIARVDFGGLGKLSRDFYKFLEPTKVLTVLASEEDDPKSFPGALVCTGGVMNLGQIEDFLKDIDVILTFETPYNWNLIKRAKEKGIKTIIIPNYEWSEPNPAIEPDLYICPSKLDYDIYKAEGKLCVYLPIPIDRSRLLFKLRRKANTFVFNNGHGGSIGRNGCHEMIEAISRTKISTKFIIRSQIALREAIIDPRVEYKFGNFTESELFRDGDVFVFPHKFDGLSLPIQEAMACGMPVITTDFYPHNEYLPKELLFPVDGFGKGKLNESKREIDIAFIYPKLLADKITEMAGRDITELSKRMNRIAEGLSWENWKDKYLEVINNLCDKETI